MVEIETANCLVLFDWSGELDPVRWFDLATHFFSEVGEKAVAGQVMQSNGLARSPRPKALEQRLRSGESFRSVSLRGRPVDPEYRHLEALVSAGYYVHRRKRTLHFIYRAGRRPLERELFIDLVFRMSAFCRPSYGYAFRRAFSAGPELFAHDIGFGESALYDDEESKRMTRWFHERTDGASQGRPAPFRHLEGMHRDVFPLNILTASHLAREIAGMPLRDWIEADAARGTIVEIVAGSWIWAVPGRAIAEVRRHLRTAGLLVDYPPDS